MIYRKYTNLFVIAALTTFCSLPVFANIERSEIEQDTEAKSALNSKVDPHFLEKIANAETVNVIVLYNSTYTSQNYSSLQTQSTQSSPSAKSLRLNYYKALKQRENNKIAVNEYQLVHEYDQLPMQALQLKTTNSLVQLLGDPDVVAIYNDEKLELHLAESLPLINDQSAISQDVKGQNTSVAILDSGVDYTNATFGGCASPGAPETCHVSAEIEIATDDGVLDSNGHGTNVAAIALGVAPETKIIALDVMNGTNISSSDAIAAINWVIANRTAYNIVAMNMSFGSSTTYSQPCSSFNPFAIPISNAKSAGISVIVSAGNNASSNGLASPACTPGALGIGAVYDSNVGGLNWSVCVDNTTKADQIGCFSNSASYLFMLAPGSMITAAGMTKSGTSQAAPHVTGAVALLKSAHPKLSLTEIETRLRQSDALITDTRNNITTPRLDIRKALGTIPTITDEIPMLPSWAFTFFIVGLMGIGIKLNRQKL